MDKALQMKVDKLQFLLKSYGGVAVAFSAGVDSTVLLKAAKETLGTEQVMALTVQSSLMPASDVEDAVTFCREEGIRHEVVQVDPLIYYDVRTNPPQRCYYCKRLIFGKLRELVGQKGIVHLRSAGVGYSEPVGRSRLHQGGYPGVCQDPGAKRCAETFCGMPCFPRSLWRGIVQRKTAAHRTGGKISSCGRLYPVTGAQPCGYGPPGTAA